MAVTALAISKVTDHSLQLLMTGDGAGATTEVVDNAQILAAIVAAGISTASPIYRLFTTAIETTADARARILGDASGLASQDLRQYEHAVVSVIPRTGSGGWIVDADTDAVTITLPEVNITDPAVVSDCLVNIEFQHTINR